MSIKIGMSASCVYPLKLEAGFRFAKAAHYDGLELMVTKEPATQSFETLSTMMDKYEMPILSVHAPVLLLTHFVWGRDPKIKLEKSAELAAQLGAETVVVHPPFRWQNSYAEEFLHIVRETSKIYNVKIAVENMFPWSVRNSSIEAYAPGPDPRVMDCDHVTLDFSHAALSGDDSYLLAEEYGDRLAHVHLCDGLSNDDISKIFDEHLMPGKGNQPVAEVLKHLAATGWTGNIVAEINTRKAKTNSERLRMLKETKKYADYWLQNPSAFGSVALDK